MSRRSLSVIVEADGGSRGNPGPAGYGAVVMDSATREVLAERSEAIGIQTNNVAEYSGLIAGLRAAQELGSRRVAVRMDSNLVVQQMRGVWQVRHPGLRPLARQAAQLRDSFAQITFDWIPREENTHADRLANEAMDRAAGRTPRAAVPDAPPAGTPPALTPPALTPPALTPPARTPTARTPTARTPTAWTSPVGPPTRLILVRHGSTVHSAERRFSGRNDLPLDAAGARQAAALARRAFGDVAGVVSSPLRRARQTAAAIAEACGRTATTNDDFAEVDFGDFEGLTSAEARQRFPAELAAWYASPDSAPPGGESFDALARRVRRGRDAVIAAYPDRTIVVVTHVSPVKTLVRMALDAPPVSLFRMHLDTASVSVVEYYRDGSSSLRLFNDVSHLQPVT